MCPRAHGGAAMVRARASSAVSAQSFAEEEYIDLDLSSRGEYEFRVCRSKPAAPCPCPDELVRRARQHKVGAKLLLDADAGATGGCGRRGTATVAPLQHSSHAEDSSHAEGSGRRRKPGKAMQARLRASRAFLRSLFARTWCADERCRGVRSGSGSRTAHDKGSVGVSGSKSAFYMGGSAAPTTLRSSIEWEKLMDEEEHAASVRQRKSFSGVIKWRPAPSSARRNSCGSAPALKRSSSCRSESEGLVQGAIAYCKRSQQQRVLLARKSVSDAALCSFRAPS